MKKYVVCIIIKTSLEGRQRITNTIMYITITRMQRHITKTETSNIRHMAYNKFPTKSKSILIKCLHQAAFSPQKQTLLQAIKNNFFYMARLHSTCRPKISLRLSTENRQGPHKKTKTRDLKYQR